MKSFSSESQRANESDPTSLFQARILGRSGSFPTRSKKGQILRVLCFCGMHGNEPAGAFAARKVLARIQESGVTTQGELVAMAGNLAGLRKGVRYQQADLNRLWSADMVNQLAVKGAQGLPLHPEEEEQRDILATLATLEAEVAPEQTVVIDMHTTSAQGIPFVLFGDTLRQRNFARAFPIPRVLGLEELVQGVLSGYLATRGYLTFAVEGGQHTDPDSVSSLEAVLWVALAKSGVLSAHDFPEVEKSRALLRERRRDLPPLLEVTRRHAITEADQFRMVPGFRNLDFAKKRQKLADDVRGEVTANEDGMIILPLYQGLGSDGFFWGRAIGAFEEHASAALRALGAADLLATLPGVDIDSAERRATITKGAERLYPERLFRLFGYRRKTMRTTRSG
jgi:predicted deacylase